MIPLMSLLYCLLVLAILMASISTYSVATVNYGNTTDQLALLDFKAKISLDPLGIFNSWNESVHFCNWYGVSCNKRHQRVRVLNLASVQLSGRISPYIGNLSFLRELHLESNKFSGQIPPQVSRLHRLEALNLQNNSLTGVIPQNISACSRLTGIILANNSLEGAIPADIEGLIKLEILNIGRNNLIGDIPPSLGNLSSLLSLYAAQNKLTGTIPASLSKLTNLRLLSLAVNRLSGTFPDSIYNLSSLRALDIGLNQIQGSLLSTAQLRYARFFSVFTNRFTGSIPASMSNMSNLQTLMLGDNSFFGDVPCLQNVNQLQNFAVNRNNLGGDGVNDLGFLTCLTNSTNLRLLSIEENNFVGKLPETVVNCSRKLSQFFLHQNQISGSIPAEIGNLVGLEIFQAGRNAFSGTIPVSIGKLQQIKYLHLHSNRLSGYIPPVIGNLTTIISLWLDDNGLGGKIPVEIGKCQQLIQLSLGKNRISGTIPVQVMRLSSLSLFLDLPNNNLTGNLPMEIERLKNLGTLDVSNNKLSGEIPSNLERCTSLEYLNMSGNLFSGSIPSTLSSLRSLRELNLSRNNFSGEIPKLLESFTSLDKLDLSYNDFDGVVPVRGPFNNVNVTSVIGNNKLCGGIPEMRLPNCYSNTKKNTSNRTMKIVLASTFIILSSIGVVACSLLFRSRTQKTKSTSTLDETGLMKLSYQDLVRATNGFSQENWIGEGGIGTVYRGILGNGATPIAIKVFKLSQPSALKSFIAECESLRSIRHRNLVRVVTACVGLDYGGNDFKALVYEFLENGSLEKWLYPTSTPVDQAPEHLTFLQRLDIAIDIACALEYLHHHCEAPVVHCDLKPSNILLDSKMNACVGDFGLAKILAQGMPLNSPQSTSSIGVRGTIGYAPPEYGMGSDVSIYGDIYSYGILLLEIFTRKRPTDEMFNGGLNLRNFVKTRSPELAKHIIDPLLLDMVRTSDRDQDARQITNEESILEFVVQIFAVGISCSVEMPIERTKMSEVVVQLGSLRSKLLERLVVQ